MIDSSKNTSFEIGKNSSFRQAVPTILSYWVVRFAKRNNTTVPEEIAAIIEHNTELQSYIKERDSLRTKRDFVFRNNQNNTHA